MIFSVPKHKHKDFYDVARFKLDKPNVIENIDHIKNLTILSQSWFLLRLNT